MKTKLFLGLAAGMLLASCAQKENLTPSVSGVVEFDQTRYLSVSLSSPASATKGFEDGDTSESIVKELIFVFYDKDGNPTGNLKTFRDNELDNAFTPYGNANVTKFWTSVVPIEMFQGQTLPAYVMCYVNPIDSKNLSSSSLLAVEASKRKAVVGNDNTFPMTNSVYYGTDPLTGRVGRLMATPVKSDQLFDSESAAQAAAESGQALDIYVERYAAKIGIDLAPNAIQDYEIDGHSLTFVPEFWRPNAIDEEMFVTKTFGLRPGEGEEFDPTKTPSYDEMNKAFVAPGWTAWNDEANHRCYWACSPSYYNNIYPRVSDDIDDLENNRREYSLKYFSYNEIAADAKSKKYENGFSTAEVDGYFYSRETTTAIEAINDVRNGNPAAAVASAVIVGHYLVDGTAASTFYLDTHNKKYYGTETDAKTMLLARQGIVFTDQEGKNIASDESAAFFTVEHPKAAVRGETPVAGRYVTLQLTESAIGHLYIYGGVNETRDVIYTQVTAENIAEVNKQLWSQVNTLEIFDNGRGFFNIPIRHLGFDAGRCLTAEGKYDWEKACRGDYGIVRNHVYNINVSSIKGLATGLRSADQPIVPPKDDVNYYVAARLNILAWNVVNAWDVEL